ncbi:hypothetical protein RB195_005749 [Necator americanus]|uniref:RNase H type-1 domain-containing protein n=1 Tax=Necator americanus TaxID=51031 RepID=A0ABR1BT86_NECAM
MHICATSTRIDINDGQVQTSVNTIEDNHLKLEVNAFGVGARVAQLISTNTSNKYSTTRLAEAVSSYSRILRYRWGGIHNRQLERLADNRLKEIRNIIGALRSEDVTVEFRYVPTTENPANAGTRGLTKSSRIIQDKSKFLR